MIYLAYFILGFSALQLLVAVSNMFFRQKLKDSNIMYASLVSVLIPARNEEKNIQNIITDLQNQNYKNIEIIIFNDISTDNTAEIVTQLALSDKRIKLINSTGLPEGWLGKNFACHSLTQQAHGEYLLFIDADVRLKDNIILNSIALAEKYQTGLLSIFPKQIMQTIGERMTVPLMNYILLSLLPLAMVLKSKHVSMAAANGQFMLFNNKAYRKYLPHFQFKNNKVEDITTAQYFKKNNIPVICTIGNNSITCRMYTSYTEAINGFSKNVSMFFGNSLFAALLFWLITTIGFIVILYNSSINIMLIYFFIYILTRIIISYISNQSIAFNLLYFIFQQLTLGVIILKSALNTKNKNFIWKGRNIS